MTLCNPHCRKNKRIHCCGSSYKGNRPWLSRYPLCGRQHFHLNTSLHKSEPESGHYEWCWTWFGQTVAFLKFLRADHTPMSSLTSGEGGEGSASMGIGMGAVPLGCTCPCSNTGWKGSDPASGEGAQTLPPQHLHSWRASARDSSVGEALMSCVVGWLYYGMLSCAQFHALLSNQMSLCFSSIGSDHVKFPTFILHLHPSWWSKQYSWRYGYSQVWWAFFIIPMSSSLTGLWCFLQKGRTGQELIPLICPHFVSRALVNSLDPHVWYGNRVVCCRAAWNFAFSLTRLGVTAQSCVVPVLLTL